MINYLLSLFAIGGSLIGYELSEFFCLSASIYRPNIVAVGDRVLLVTRPPNPNLPVSPLRIRLALPRADSYEASPNL